ncbi:argininosuccinate lyase [Fulvimarina pelagi HTCC2506]|uniref:Argininosuccinate lyase n=1 Tax=Fulvimarina pelagi HTCC2506 TaxID=314231 RepID=Q0G117_9HYPH|nr:hypothetical protein [Fulvimarina pelagi]EAU40822.1 argininosuccinate lyase [Fulvimarina pelagi HTCC2506]
MSNGFLRTLIVAAPMTALLLAGCGVKNLPRAPGTDNAPAGFAEPERGGDTDIIGGSRDDDALLGPRIATSGTDDDDQIGAAEVSRTPGAADRSFFLDPLLN